MNSVGADDDFGNECGMPGILASKLMPPAGNSTQLGRPHLTDMMLGARSARLILVRAGAGFGKTTLMQQYLARCREIQRTVIWLRVDTEDNDLQRFLAHLDAGLHALPRTRTPQASTNLTGGRLSNSVLERMASCTQPFSIMFDDFEAVQSVSVLNFVQRLIQALPPDGTVVIGSRVTPEIGLGRIRARGELADINPSALRFSLDETTTFIREKCALPLRDAEIATLHRCTEGWATGIYLATLSLRTRSDHAAFVASFSGTNLELAEYLAEDILATQTEACRSFLLDTSVLNPFSAELCDAVTGRSDSREMLDYLERSNLFLIPLDSEQLRYRYHRLFASFLRHRLHAGNPERERHLNIAAAQWYIDARRPVPAINHLLDADDAQAALDQIALHTPALLRTGRIRLMARWLDRIPAQTIASHPRIGLISAWVLLLNRRYADAMQTIERILAEHEEGVARETLALEAEAMRCVLFAMTDQIEACQQAGSALLSRLPPGSNMSHSIVANALAYSLVSMHRYDDARSVLSRALQYTQDRPFVLMRSIAQTLEGLIDIVQGRLGTALARLETASANSSSDLEGGVSGGRTTIEISRSLALYESDALDEATRLLNDALPHAKSNSTPDGLITSHLLSARIAYVRGDKDLAERVLAELEQIGRVIDSARLICSAWLERARMATLENRFEAAQQALSAAATHSDWFNPDITFHANDVDQPFIAQCRLDVAEGNHATAATGLCAAIELAVKQQRYRRVLKLRILLVMALDGLGERERAFDELTEALRTASHEGFIRTFLDEGPRLAKLIELWAERYQEQASLMSIVPAFVTTLLTGLAPQVADEPKRSAIAQTAPYGAADALTVRELDVLRMLSAGHRNRVIAEKLFVSELTIKSHLRKINSKLGAQNRTQAVAIGRSRGLID